MKLALVKGTTSQTAIIFVQDSSATDGSGLTGLAWNSSGLTWYYYREGQGTGGTQVTLASATLGTWTSGGFVEVDATNMPGWYEIGIPDAALATGADFVGMTLRGATNMADCPLEIQLTDFDLNDATPDVNVAQLGGDAQSATDLKDFADAGYDPATNKVEGVKLVDTTTANTDMRGTDDAALASVCTEARLAELDAANLPSDVDAILADTGTDGVIVATNNDKTDYSLATDQSTVTIGTVNALASGAVNAIWNALTSGMTTVGSIGKKLADWVLGSDDKVEVSADAHTSGQTVAAVTGAVGSVTGDVGGDVVGDVQGKVLGGGASSITGTGAQAQLPDGAITAAKFGADAVDANALAADAVDEIVADILATPANKLVTDANGYVTAATAEALGAQAKIDMNTEADGALADYDPPTKAEMDAAHALLATASDLAVVDGNVDDIADATVIATGTVSDASPSATDFDTDLTEATDGHYDDCFLLFTDGPNAGRRPLAIATYTAANGNVAFDSPGWGDTPVNGNAFVIIGASFRVFVAG